MRRPSSLVVTSFALFGLVAVACGDDNSSSPATTAAGAATSPTTVTVSPTTAAAPTTTEAPTTTAAPTVSGDVTVFAASSLTAAYTEIGNAFKTANPNSNVVFNFAASSDLVTQINQGAAADVYASA